MGTSDCWTVKCQTSSVLASTFHHETNTLQQFSVVFGTTEFKTGCALKHHPFYTFCESGQLILQHGKTCKLGSRMHRSLAYSLRYNDSLSHWIRSIHDSLFTSTWLSHFWSPPIDDVLSVFKTQAISKNTQSSMTLFRFLWLVDRMVGFRLRSVNLFQFASSTVMTSRMDWIT